MRLKEAVRVFQQEEGAPQNAYDWYRRSASKYGYTSLGDVQIPTRKMGRDWHVDEGLVEQAVRRHRARRQLVRENSEAYERGVILGKEGEYVETLWGGYRRRGAFYVSHSRYPGEGESWRCATCKGAAAMKREREECHRCRDWGSCGRDCRLSKVTCRRCGHALEF
jgi:hypothetical protein